MKLANKKSKTIYSSETKQGIPISSLFTGMLIGTILCILNIFVLFKTGTSFGGSAVVAVLGTLLLRFMGALNWRNLFLAFSIASSGYYSTAAIDSGIIAIYLQQGTLPPWWIAVSLAVGANVMGILFGAMIADLFVHKQKLPYPTIQPAIAMLQNLTKPNRFSIFMIPGFVVGAGIIVLEHVFHSEFVLNISNVPEFIGLSASPLLFGIGILVRQKTAAWILIGSLYSIFVWLCLDGSPNASYSEHLSSPWILGWGISLILGVSLASFVRDRKVVYRSIDSLQKTIGQEKWPWFFLSIVGVVATIWLVSLEGIIYGIAGTIGVLILIILSLFYLNRSGGEIGIAPLLPVFHLSLITMALLNFQQQNAILAASAVACLALSSVYYSYSVKIADGHHEVHQRDIIWTQILGSITGAVIGILFILLLINSGKIRDQTLPVPTAVSLNYLFQLLQENQAHIDGVLPLLLGGMALGFTLSFTSVLPSSIGIGVLLPPSYTLTIFLGGITRWIISKQKNGNSCFLESLDMFASGLIVGEGLLTMAFLIIGAL